MTRIKHPHQAIEILESRIAPAAVTVFPTVKDAELAYDAAPFLDKGNFFIAAKPDAFITIRAGQVLSTTGEARSGTYLMFVEQGEARIFTTDLNNNNQVDTNEITGISAGNGLRLISFVDIHGDIVTNLDADGSLSDSNNNAIGDDPFLLGDGKVLTNARIEKITLRSLTFSDLTDQDPLDDDGGAVDETDVFQRLALSSYSIHGNIFAGGGVGVSGDTNSGIVIDAAGIADQQLKFTGFGTTDLYIPFTPTIGAIKVGSAASGEYFSFGVSKANDIQGELRTFTPTPGQAGASIVGVKTIDPTTKFNVSAFIAGNGGAGAAGGNIENIQLSGDSTGGYTVRAGDGGRGTSGGDGGSILNFADFGSITSIVTLQTGDGGLGTINTGGNGGAIVLTGAVTTTTNVGGAPVTTTTIPFNVNGSVSFILGDGGDGFRAGGAGASLSKGKVASPTTPAPYGRNVIGTTHDGPHNPLTGKLIGQGVIGRTLQVDFDQDGFGDVVFSTTDPGQLVVQFGAGDGTFRRDILGNPDRIYLDAPVDAEAITVGDFNGDGHQDIAAASQAPGAFGGIFVYLSKWEDANVNGLTTDEDINQNGVDEFIRFNSVRQSPLPTLNKGDADGGVILDTSFLFFRSANAITDIEAGDFNGDGYTDLAVSVTYVTVGFHLGQVVVVLNSDIEDGRPTGEFFADFGTKKTSTVGANPYAPFILDALSGAGLIEATALSTASTYDVILALPIQNTLDVGGIQEVTLTNGLSVYDFSALNINGAYLSNVVVFSGVDTNRLLPTNNPNISYVTPIGLRDFTVLDFDNDAKADFAALTEVPTDYIVANKGDGNGGSIPYTINQSAPTQNAGLYLAGPPGYGLAGTFHSLRVTDADSDGQFDEIAILNHLGVPNPMYRIVQIAFVPRAAALLNAQPGGALAGNYIAALPLTKAVDTTVTGFDIFIPNSVAPTVVQYATVIPEKTQDRPVFHQLDSTGPANFIGDYVPHAEHTFNFTAGDGGDSLIGRGGAGGSLGGGVIKQTDTTVGGFPSVTVSSDLQVTIPSGSEFDGRVIFHAGDGGNGFTNGGRGGFLQGLLVRYTDPTLLNTSVELYAGNGGLGVAASGGKGGDIVGVSIESGGYFQAGNGGRGVFGGSGGSIIGNGQDFLYDTRELYVGEYVPLVAEDARLGKEALTVGLQAGLGANGVRRGGNGGSIVNFKASFDLLQRGAVGGIMSYVAGDGGSAVSGPGGNGGSIINASPMESIPLNLNLMGGDIFLRGGDGGNGSTGGNGGSVLNFVDKPSTDEKPSVLSLIAGGGGNGSSGKGGNGGNVSGISVSTRGNLHPNAFIAPAATAYTYNRILAGNGGNSAGSVGGNGGSVSNVQSGSDSNPFVVAAGSGGNGLSRGGNGGGVSNTSISISPLAISKILIVAGNGGDAGAFAVNPLDTSFQNQGPKTFGGKVGKGGDGGSVFSIRSVGPDNSRMDIIAGNGGDTVFYGSVGDLPKSVSSTAIGKGGSIRDVNTDGTLGNILPNIPIKSYFDFTLGESMKTFVDSQFRDPLAPGSAEDSAGNVGLVVGAAGRLKKVFSGYSTNHTPIFESAPAPGGKNGNLGSITATAILSAVAGNVARIAAIQTVSGITIDAGQEVGVDKPDIVNYINKFGLPVEKPEIDGALVDGAIISSTQATNLKKQTVFLPGNVYVIA